ncbi:MAG: hypothetical protein K9M82_09865 [Deltaproteobacteria bacterium]|nr:hypothetical protein [Deltaproteobacteria bacterium]
MPILFWWIRNVVLLAAGLFFLLFGVHLLVLAYRLNDPFNFVMTFFASNLIILISATVMAGLVIRMVAMIRGRGLNKKDSHCE